MTSAPWSSIDLICASSACWIHSWSVGCWILNRVNLCFLRANISFGEGTKIDFQCGRGTWEEEKKKRGRERGSELRSNASTLCLWEHPRMACGLDYIAPPFLHAPHVSPSRHGRSPWQHQLMCLHPKLLLGELSLELGMRLVANSLKNALGATFTTALRARQSASLGCE